MTQRSDICFLSDHFDGIRTGKPDISRASADRNFDSLARFEKGADLFSVEFYREIRNAVIVVIA